MYRSPFEKGRLIVRFTVNFPCDDWMGAEKFVELEKFLPSRQEIIIPDNAEDCVLHKVNPGMDNPSGRRLHEAYDTSADEIGGQRVQCASH